MDAYVCAYIALHHWTSAHPDSRVIGDLERGYIVTPLTTADGALDTALTAELDAAEASVNP